MVKGEDKHKGTLKIGRTDELFVGKAGVIRGVQIKTAKEFPEQPVQLLNPPEFQCDNITDVFPTVIQPCTELDAKIL